MLQETLLIPVLLLLLGLLQIPSMFLEAVLRLLSLRKDCFGKSVGIPEEMLFVHDTCRSQKWQNSLILDESSLVLSFSSPKFLPARIWAEFGHKMPEGAAWRGCGCHCANTLAWSVTLERELQWDSSGWVPTSPRCVTGTGPCWCLVAGFAHRIVSPPSLLGRKR